MPLRPIDMHVMLPKLSQINEAKQTVINHTANANHDAQLENKRQQAVRARRVRELERGELLRVNRQYNRQGKRQKKRQHQSETDEQQYLDIKI